jgi:hypothetical protein
MFRQSVYAVLQSTHSSSRMVSSSRFQNSTIAAASTGPTTRPKSSWNQRNCRSNVVYP